MSYRGGVVRQTVVVVVCNSPKPLEKLVSLFISLGKMRPARAAIYGDRCMGQRMDLGVLSSWNSALESSQSRA